MEALVAMPAKRELAPVERKPVSIVVDDGAERVPILNKFGDEIGVFYVRPTDVGLLERYNAFVRGFDSIIKPVNGVSLNSDGTPKEPSDEQALATLNEAKKSLSEALDRMLDGNFAEAFFGRMHPFSVVGGRFYCEIAVEAVGQYIGQRFDQEIKRVNARVDKYTHGYRTGKHQGGGQRRRKGNGRK